MAGSAYLTAAERNNLSPNFWMSEEYLTCGGFVEVEENGWIWVMEPGQLEQAFLPPIALDPGKGMGLPPRMSVWASPVNFAPVLAETYAREFLDWEYVFHPADFLHMEGGAWAVFRKNSRKWERNRTGVRYGPLPTSMGLSVASVLRDWFDAADREVQDADAMIKFVLEGEHREGVWDNGGLKAVNVWDVNYAGVNFRYSVCRSEPWLPEYARLRFYLARYTEGVTFVNDGGSMDNPQLEAFKDKMNPAHKRPVYSWTPLG